MGRSVLEAPDYHAAGDPGFRPLIAEFQRTKSALW